jgi:nucleotide-binding universal stress UspA family protein
LKPNVIVSVLESLQAEKDAALTRALALAQWYESDLHIVVVHPGNRDKERKAQGIRGATDARIAHLVSAARASSVNAVPAVLSGHPVRAIADYADRVSADLLVVGSTARPASRYRSAGSFATALGKAVKCPTIAVSVDHREPPAPGILFRNILVPIDFSDVSVRALTAALLLAQQSGEGLRLLHVLEGFPYESVYSGARALRLPHDLRLQVARANQRLQSLIPADALNWCDIDVATVSGRPDDAIVAAASEEGADLIVLGLPRRSRVEELVVGSTAHRVLRRASAPVLLIPGPSVRPVAPSEQGEVSSAPHPDLLAWHAAATRPKEATAS